MATNWKKYISWNGELAVQPTQGNKSTCECELVDGIGHILPSMDSWCLAVHLQAPESSTNDLLLPNKAFSGPFYDVHMYITGHISMKQVSISMFMISTQYPWEMGLFLEFWNFGELSAGQVISVS